MMKARKRKKDEIDFDRNPTYQRLLADVRKVIEEAKAKGVCFGDRTDLFECKNCGAYEDVLFGGDGRRKTFLKSKKETTREFIEVDRTERSRTRAGRIHFTIRYQLICSICGAFQTQTFRESFESL